jgi:hypothetical protein
VGVVPSQTFLSEATNFGRYSGHPNLPAGKFYLRRTISLLNI